ncbi:MAG: sulfite exporter TauE/SafE family protein [Arachnia sp.]
MTELRSSRVPAWVAFVGIGLASGLMSGLFGVGGGTVIVPLLVLLASFDQRLASGTSLAAIVPTALVGVVTYAVMGEVAWVAALLLAAGAVVGAQIGTWLLPKLPIPVLRWGFVAFLVVVIINLFLVVPSRDAVLDITLGTGIGLLVAGLVTGILSGLLGVGGGVIVVPVLILLFGASDLIAKGTSLLMMIPTALSGTLGNLRRHNVDLKAGLFIGLGACVSTAFGAQLAQLLDPKVATPLFAIFLTFIAIQLVLKARKAAKSAKA